MSLEPKQAAALLSLVGLAEKHNAAPGTDPETRTDLLDRIVRRIQVDLIVVKDDILQHRLHKWPRVSYHAMDLYDLIGRPYLTAEETNDLQQRLKKLHISLLCPTFEDLVVTMQIQFPTPAKQHKRRHHRH